MFWTGETQDERVVAWRNNRAICAHCSADVTATYRANPLGTTHAVDHVMGCCPATAQGMSITKQELVADLKKHPKMYFKRLLRALGATGGDLELPAGWPWPQKNTKPEEVVPQQWSTELEGIKRRRLD